MRPYRGFADLIRSRRKELKLTLEAAAGAADWSIPYLSELERGLKQPPPESKELIQLATVLRLDSRRLAREAVLSRRSVEIDLDGAGVAQRRLAVLLARRMERGLSDEEAEALIEQLKQRGGDDEESDVE